MLKTLLLTAIIAMTIAAFSTSLPVSHVKAQCPFSKAAQSTGQIICDRPQPGGYTSTTPGGENIIVCNGLSRSLKSDGNIVAQRGC